MSRAELADAVNAELWRTTGRRYALDAHTIARYERGVVRWPSAAYRSALRTVLGATSDEALGFRPTRRGSSGRSMSSDGPASGRDLGDLQVHSPVPARVGWTEVEQVRRATAALAASDNMYGGGLTCHGAVAQLRWTSGLLSVPANAQVRAALTEAVGNMAGVVAFASFDIGDYSAAGRCFRFALQCAEDSGSWSLRSNTLADMSRLAAHSGRLDEALSLIELAQVRADRVTPTARAMMSMLRGRVLALLGHIPEAADELRLSDEWMGQSDPALDPPWLCYYDRAEHQGSTGRGFSVIASGAGDPQPAVRRLEEAVALAGERYPRSRTFSRIRLATLLMRNGDVDDAVAVGVQALREAREFHSLRMSAELKELAHTSRSRSSKDAVQLSREIEAHTH